MDDLKPKDFLFGCVPDIKHTICNEYTSKVKLTPDSVTLHTQSFLKQHLTL